MLTNQIIKMEDQYQLTTYRKIPLVISQGEGVYVYDTHGRRYLDFYGGHAVAITGHSHPHVVNAISQQAERLMFYSNIVYNDVRPGYTKLLADLAPEGLNQAFFCNSGSEANETALKIARRHTTKTEVIAMQNGFHGRTIGSLSATELGHYREMFRPLIEAYHFAEFGSLASAESLINDNTAAIIVEPIQSLAGAYLAEPEYYQGLRQLCDEHGLVLIFDEIQTGLGRTGAMFAGDNWGVVPDIITLAKGLASGFPIGATLVHDDIAAHVSYGEHGSTFGAGPMACAASRATLEVIAEGGLVDHARTLGAYIKEKIGALPGVETVRGLGLLVGIETAQPAKDVQKALLEAGFIVGTSAQPNTIRLLPPLIIEQGHVDELVAALTDIL